MYCEFSFLRIEGEQNKTNLTHGINLKRAAYWNILTFLVCAT